MRDLRPSDVEKSSRLFTWRGSKIENRGYHFLIFKKRRRRTGGLFILNYEEDLDVYGVRLLGIGSMVARVCNMISCIYGLVE